MRWPNARSSLQNSVSELATECPASPFHWPPSIGLAQSAGPHTESPDSATEILIDPSIVNAVGSGQETPRNGNIFAIHQEFSDN